MKAREIRPFVYEMSGLLDLNTSRGYGQTDNGIDPADLKDNDPDKVRECCVHIWAAFFQPFEAYTTPGSRAICTLALYASGHEKAVLDKAEFRRSEKKLRRYASEMSAHNPHNESIAAYVLKHAKRRALRQDLIGTRSHKEQPVAPVGTTVTAVPPGEAPAVTSTESTAS
jgi:hypothetical protein